MPGVLAYLTAKKSPDATKAPGDFLYIISNRNNH